MVEKIFDIVTYGFIALYFAMWLFLFTASAMIAFATFIACVAALASFNAWMNIQNHFEEDGTYDGL